MNPIASVIARIDAIESRLGQAVAQTQARSTQLARTAGATSSTAAQAAAQRVAGTLPAQRAASPFAAALETVERSVVDAVEQRQNSTPTARNVSLEIPATTRATNTSAADLIGNRTPVASRTVSSTPTTSAATAANGPTATAPSAPAATTSNVAPVPVPPEVAPTVSEPTFTLPTRTPTAAAPMRPLDGLAETAAGGVGSVPFAPDFAAAGERHGVPPRLLSAMAFIESRYLPDVVADRGATGLMQLMPETADKLGVDPTNPIASIDGAARLMGSLYDQFGSWDLALAAYHTGADTVADNGNAATGRGNAYANRVLDRLAVMETS